MFDSTELEILDAYAWSIMESAPREAFASTKQMPAAAEVVFDYLAYLNILNRPHITLTGAKSPKKDYLGAAKAWSAKFVGSYITHIRAAICKKKKGRKGGANGTATATATASALATWVTSEFGVSGPVAIGIAALVIHTLASAGIKSFCDSTDIDVVEKLSAKFSI